MDRGVRPLGWIVAWVLVGAVSDCEQSAKTVRALLPLKRLRRTGTRDRQSHDCEQNGSMIRQRVPGPLGFARDRLRPVPPTA